MKRFISIVNKGDNVYLICKLDDGSLMYRSLVSRSLVRIEGHSGFDNHFQHKDIPFEKCYESCKKSGYELITDEEEIDRFLALKELIS